MPASRYRVSFSDGVARVNIVLSTAEQALQFLDALAASNAADVQLSTLQGEPLIRADLVVLLAQRLRARRRPTSKA